MMVGALLYGDDLLLVIAGGRDEGACELQYVRSELARLGLEPSPDKTGVYRMHDRWKMLNLLFDVDPDGRLTITPSRDTRRRLTRLVKRAVAGVNPAEPVDDPDGRFITAVMPRTSYYARMGADLSSLNIAADLEAAGIPSTVARRTEDHLLLRRPLRTSRRDGWSTEDPTVGVDNPERI